MSIRNFSFVTAPFKTLGRRLSPLAVSAIKYLSAEMEYVPGGWYDIQGWNDPDIIAAQERHWPTLLRNLEGPGPLGVSHLPWHNTRDDLLDHNIMMSYGYVIAMAAKNGSTLSILDWGGGAGQYYLYTRVLLPDIAIDYHNYDLPSLCRLGRKLLLEAHMVDDERVALARQYDVVVSSSSLHYFQDWRAELRKLASCTGEFLYVSRLQVVAAAPSFVVLHRPSRTGYSEFLSWCINQQEFLSCAAENGLTLLREFVFTDYWTIRKGPEKGQCRGFLLTRRPSAATND